jgi:25S rRNA (uracil2634-N3)-methyltransferase
LIVATSYDTEDSLYEKYPHAKDILAQLRANSKDQIGKHVDADEFHGFSPSPSRPSSPSEERSANPSITIHHSINATKLSTSHKKALRRHGPFTKIVFNFPHIGGLSTDINRQTRANQQLIQGFFAAATPFLVAHDNPLRQRPPSPDESDRPNQDMAPGQILVTLFAGEAYTDWNIRDIARSQGLRVVESFRFPWEAYPGYRHARTGGEVKTGRDRSDEGKRRGAWRGEEREARCFVFEVGSGTASVGMGKRRPSGEESESESE